MHHNTLAKLIRILGLLGSDQPGERASAALAAHRLIEAGGQSWAELLHAPPTKPAARRSHEYGVDPVGAAEARMRQLKSTNERLEREVRALRRRLTTIADRQRRQRALAEGAAEDQP
jgi:hypothetical protein